VCAVGGTVLTAPLYVSKLAVCAVLRQYLLPSHCSAVRSSCLRPCVECCDRGDVIPSDSNSGDKRTQFVWE